MTFDAVAVTNEVSDRIAEIGRRTLPVAKPAAYDSPEGVLFRKALALIEREENWCINTLRKIGDNGQQQFCSVGALKEAMGGYGHPAFGAIQAAMGDMPNVYNNTHTHAEVIAAWTRAGKDNGWLL